MKLWENWKLLGILGIIAGTIVGIIFGITRSQEGNSTTPTRHRRSTASVDVCLRRYGGIELNYIANSTTSFTLDLCALIKCRGMNSSWRGYDVYLCAPPARVGDCEQNVDNLMSKVFGGEICSDWGQVTKTTGLYKPNPHYLTKQQREWWGKVAVQRDYSGSQNPLTISLGHISASSYRTNKIIFWIGVNIWGKDPQTMVQINIIKPNATLNNETVKALPIKNPKNEVVEIDYTKLKPEDIIEKATGYGENNLWLEWITTTAREQGLDDCVGCANARPRLHTEPAPLHPEDKWGYDCMLALTREAKPNNCSTLATIFPPITNRSKTGPFTPQRANYTCFNITRSSPTSNLGEISSDWCSQTVIDNGTQIGLWARAGLYYYCGDRRLFTRIPEGAKGVCAMVRLGAPIALVGERTVRVESNSAATLTRRRRRHILRKRAISSSVDLSLNSPTYIDAIGVPRGVPNEYKLVDQIASGFENIPIISALFPVTPNKNIDRINYVHYNVMRLANMTRDAVDGLAEQLAPTSLMAIQNRMALDMLLAEKGGVCFMFGDLCCTYIPNNTAPDGSVTRALEGLKTLSVEMKEHSGVDNPVGDWLDKALGKWKAVVMSIVVSIGVFLAILITCGCCCIPCIRSLCNRLIVTAIEKKESPPPYSMPLLSSDLAENEEEDDV